MGLTGKQHLAKFGRVSPDPGSLPNRILWLGTALAILYVASQYLNGCHTDTSISHVSKQVHSGDVTQIKALRQQAAFLQAEKFHDSIRDVAMQEQLENMSAAISQKSDSLAWLRRENEKALLDRERQNSLFLNRFDQLASDNNMVQRRNLDSISAKFARVEKAISDSAMTGRMASAAFEQVYKTANLNDKWFDSRILFSKSDSGKRKASVSPTFRNSMEAEITKYVPPKKGVAGSVTVTVLESNPYAATRSKAWELPVPPLKGRQKKAQPVRHTPQQKQTLNWFDRLWCKIVRC